MLQGEKELSKENRHGRRKNLTNHTQGNPYEKKGKIKKGGPNSLKNPLHVGVRSSLGGDLKRGTTLGQKKEAAR